MYQWDIGIWDNYFGEGIEKVLVVAPTKLEAKRLTRNYINNTYRGSHKRFVVDTNQTTKIPSYTNQIGVFSNRKVGSV